MIPISLLISRDELADWLNSNKLVGCGAEIGCAYGGYARLLLSKWDGKSYLMVDPWKCQPKDIYKENTDSVNYEGWYEDCLRLSKKDPRVNILRGLSVDIAARIPEGSLDFVFIDGNHCFEAVTADLNAWWPKVKVGGLFSGHDFYNDTTRGHYCEVANAVIQWMKDRNFGFWITQCTGWWHVKTSQ